MDDLEDLQASEFVTDTEDQDSLDERIDSEQRICNHQLWASFQTAASCITKLYKDRSQTNVSPWVPFQNAASNLATLYKDCIESQKRFARIGYQVGRRRQIRDLNKLLKKHKIPTKQLQTFLATERSDHNTLNANDFIIEDHSAAVVGQQQQHNNVASSILAVNKLNLGCDESPSHSMQAQPSSNMSQQPPTIVQQQQSNMQVTLGNNNEDDLVTFQQALAQPPAAKGGVKSSQISRRPCSNSSGYLNSRSIDLKSEEQRLLELNQFLSEEYHRHVGSKKRSCSNVGGNFMKRLRE